MCSGRHIYAVGGSERAAAFAGLKVNRIKIWVYTLGGGLSAVAGLILTARLDAADPKAGLGYELDSIAAVVIGGTSLSGEQRLESGKLGRGGHEGLQKKTKRTKGFRCLWRKGWNVYIGENVERDMQSLLLRSLRFLLFKDYFH